LQLNTKYILTDIEGTTTSVSFVYDILFPYFRENINDLLLEITDEINYSFSEVKKLTLEEEGINLDTNEDVIKQLLKWSNQDKKITPLKNLQGILWKKGYESGILKGHLYEDVPPALADWKNRGLKMGVFSSGSVEAQKLIFGYSIFGDLCPYFSDFFDTKTGGKRELETYTKIAKIINLIPNEILFLSDINEELVAANEAGFQTIQLIRPNTIPSWEKTAENFLEIKIN
jgi:enolase-phosphatase E1